MPLVLDPTKPADTESPTLGASRMRSISTFLLQLLGFAGSSQVTLGVAPFSAINTSTGAITTANKLTLGAGGTTSLDAVGVSQISPNTLAGSNAFVKMPGGLIIQWFSTATMTSPQSFTWGTAFSSAASYVTMVSFISPVASTSVEVTQTNTTITIQTGNIGTQQVNILGIGV